MVHILNNEKVDTDLMAMLYNLLSKRDPIIYLITNSIYSVPLWSQIIDRARYWFSEVHLVVGQPWFLGMARCNIFDSVNVYISHDKGGIFTPVVDELTMRPSTLTTHTCIINGNKTEQYYKNYVKVKEVRKDFPFGIEEILIDDDLSVYNSLKSRIGDLS